MAESETIGDYIRAGSLQRALEAAKETVRASPVNTRSRIVLFELLSLNGDWSRALLHANTVGKLGDDESARLFSDLAGAEAARDCVFAGITIPAPFPLSDVPGWFDSLVKSFAARLADAPLRFDELRGQVKSSMGQLSVEVDGVSGHTLMDGDERIGPCLEIIYQSNYFWLPVSGDFTLSFEPPTSLRDLVWRPALLEMGSAEVHRVFLPARFHIDPSKTWSDSLLLGRETAWEKSNRFQQEIGRGQKVLSTEVEDFPILGLSRLSVSGTKCDQRCLAESN